ncbi:MAG: hypothetical protein KF789_13830 [Bdellovibrionaceae bacterium]|nr:hypothetical protein [Pseudobdellovibrionaceae bacterium]
MPPAASSVVIPVTLVCAAPATSQGIFQFSGEGQSLLAEFQNSGDTVIKGKASVLVREQGDHSVFEGLIDVEGTRSADARTYNLKAKVKDEDWVFELRREGDSTLWRHSKGRSSKTYYSNCAEPGSF